MSQVWYSDLLAQSLRNAFEASEALDAALDLHFEERRVRDVEEALPHSLPRTVATKEVDVGGRHELQFHHLGKFSKPSPQRGRRWSLALPQPR